MKKLGLILGLLLITFSTHAQEEKGVTLTVTIENVLSDSGTILGSLHTADTFMKGSGIENATVKANPGEVMLTFKNVKPGKYAMMVIHDTNDNHQMDMEPNGMPKESYGTSGDIELYGPPTFEGSKFEVGNTDLDIRIRF